MAQVGISMTWNRQLMSFKSMCREREYLVKIARIMERNTHTTCNHLTWQQFADTTQKGEYHLIVNIKDATHLADGLLVIGTRTPNLIHVAYGLLRDFMQPDGVRLHGEDIDIDTLFLPQTIVAVLF